MNIALRKGVISDIIFCFDKDIDEEMMKSISDKFVRGVNIYALIDKDNVLEEKESPSDSKEKFEILLKNNLHKLSESE